jgi:hypothetical protein
VPWFGSVLLAVVLASGAATPIASAGNHNGNGLYCTATAEAAQTACESEVEDDYWIAIGNCTNVSNSGARKKCLKLAESERDEGAELCVEQFDARSELCGDLGEARYDPAFDPADFVDPLEIGGAVDPNPYFPLEQGRVSIYEGGGEVITVTVTDKTKLIAGVTCLVVNDVVEEDGSVIEDTDDWYAQDLDENVWYCGEDARDFELQDGEEEPELVSIEGSWKAFRDHAKPGILMWATPQVGQVYRQEMALGDAEDAAEILDVGASEAVPAAICDGDCVVTMDFTPLEPGVFEYKYYAPGVGLILEVDPESGDRLELLESYD